MPDNTPEEKFKCKDNIHTIRVGGKKCLICGENIEVTPPQEEKCTCGAENLLGNAEVEIGGVCHRPTHPCYIIDHTPPNKQPEAYPCSHCGKGEYFVQEDIDQAITSQRASDVRRLEVKIEEALKYPMRGENGVANYEYNMGYLDALQALLKDNK